MTGLEVFCIGENEYRKDIMDRIDTCLYTAVNRHCKVFIVSLLVRFPKTFVHDGKNAHVSELLRRIGMHYDFHKVDCWYVWAREQVTSANPHYHVFMALNGSRVDIGRHVLWLAARIWTDVLKVPSDGCIELCERYNCANGIRIIRPANHLTGDQLRGARESYETRYRAARDWGRYLAKTYSKGDAPHGVRERGSSRF
jgi:hypothetical protein